MRWCKILWRCSMTRSPEKKVKSTFLAWTKTSLLRAECKSVHHHPRRQKQSGPQRSDKETRILHWTHAVWTMNNNSTFITLSIVSRVHWESFSSSLIYPPPAHVNNEQFFLSFTYILDKSLCSLHFFLHVWNSCHDGQSNDLYSSYLSAICRWILKAGITIFLTKISLKGYWTLNKSKKKSIKLLLCLLSVHNTTHAVLNSSINLNIFKYFIFFNNIWQFV